MKDKTEARLRRKEARMWITQVLIPGLTIIGSFTIIIIKMIWEDKK